MPSLRPLWRGWVCTRETLEMPFGPLRPVLLDERSSIANATREIITPRDHNASAGASLERGPKETYLPAYLQVQIKAESYLKENMFVTGRFLIIP